MVGACGLWLAGAWMIDRIRIQNNPRAPLLGNLKQSH